MLANTRTLTLSTFVALPLSFALACSPAGTQAHDMSAAQHQAAATQEELQASNHAAQVDPNARELQTRCNVGKGRVCWTQSVNPTAGHGDTADEHRDIAAKHRAASQALRDAEATSCVGITDEDRDTSPFAHTSDIRSVSKLTREEATGKSRVTRDAGATVVFRAAPGLTAEWLQRIVDCHLARNAAVGHDMPEMSTCPLVPRDVTAQVRSVGDGFAIDVASTNISSAAEIWRRAQTLASAQ